MSVDPRPRLKTVAKVTYGLGQPPPPADTGIPIIRATNISRGRIDPTGLIFAIKEDIPLDRAPLLEQGEILVVRSGAYTGDSALVTSDWVGSAPGYDLRVSPFGAEPRFLAYVLLSTYGMDQIDLVRTRAAQPHLNAEDLGELRLWLPPISYQRAIADYLDRETARIDALIAKNQQMLTLLEEKFLETVRDQVTGGMPFDDPLGIRSDERLKTGWAPVKLAQDLRFGSGTTPTAGEEHYYGGAIPWIVTGDLRDGLLETVPGSVTPEALLEFSALRVHPVGALIVAMYGATVGRLAISTLPAAVNQACCVMHSGVRLRTWFVFYYLLSHRQVLMERAVGAGQPNISQEILRSLRLAAPDLAAQDHIVSVLDGLRSRVGQLSSRIRSQIDLLSEHQQALITAAITGELEVPGIAA